MTKLINGCIPARTECPWKETCNPGICHHKGKDHTVPFSCASARGFELVERYTTEKKGQK